MKRFVPIASSLVLLASQLSSPAWAASLSATDHKILNAFAEVSTVCAENRGATWPGFNLSTQPIAIYEKGRVAFLFNHPHPPAGFSPLPGVPAALRGHVYVHWGSVPELDRVHDIAVDLGGAKVAFLPYQYLAYGSTLYPAEFISPLFAYYSKRSFPTFVEFQQNARSYSRSYPSGGTEVAALTNLESRILAESLQERDANKVRFYAREFAAVDKARESKLPAQIVRFEKLATSLEGAMRYTETVMSSMGAAHDHHTLPGTSWGSAPEPSKQIVARLSQPTDTDAARRARLSATGVALGLLMDRMGYASWKGLVTAGTPITDVFAKAAKFNAYDSASLLDTAKRTFGYDQMLAEAKDSGTRFPTSYKDFMKGSGTKIVVSGLQRVSDDHRSRLDTSKPGGEWVRLASMTPPIEVDAHTLLAYRLNAFNYRKGATDLTLRQTPVLMRSSDLSWPFQNVTFFSGDQAVHVSVDGREVAVHDGVYPVRHGLRLTAGNNVSVSLGQGTMKVSGHEIQLNLK